MDVARFFPSVQGKSGLPKETRCPITIEFNEKGGMDDSEFEKYIFN